MVYGRANEYERGRVGRRRDRTLSQRGSNRRLEIQKDNTRANRKYVWIGLSPLFRDQRISVNNRTNDRRSTMEGAHGTLVGSTVTDRSGEEEKERDGE